MIAKNGDFAQVSTKQRFFPAVHGVARMISSIIWQHAVTQQGGTSLRPSHSLGNLFLRVRWSGPQPRRGIRGQCLTKFFLRPPNFVVPRKKFLSMLYNKKILLPQIFLPPQTLKSGYGFAPALFYGLGWQSKLVKHTLWETKLHLLLLFNSFRGSLL